MRQLTINESDQKRLQRQFDDRRIIYGWNPVKHQNEAWYKPEHKRPYMICTAQNVCHAIKQIENRVKYEKYSAEQLIRNIDEHNTKIVDDIQREAMTELRTEMKQIATGKQHFRMR